MTTYRDLPLQERLKRNPVSVTLAALLLAIVPIKLFSGERGSQEQRGQTDAALLHVCIEHIAKDQEDFDKAFGSGAIELPSGTVFEMAGPAFGPASDPRDISHAKQPTGWIGISNAEATRRGAMLARTLIADPKHNAALITLGQASLTRSQPCSDVPVAAALSSEWGWTVSPISGSHDSYYQAAGFSQDGQYHTPDSGRTSLDDVMLAGTLNGLLRGVTQNSITIPSN